MENRNLFTFKRVCELNSITKAAEQLGYAQSTVTTQIKLLESELDVRLFERYGNTIRITEAGEKLLAYSNEIFRITDRFLNAMHEEKEVSGLLRIAAVDSVCMTILPKILKQFIQKYPNVNVKIISGVTDELKQFLSAGKADIAFVLDFDKPAAELALLLEKKLRLDFYAAADQALEFKDLGIEELKKQKFVLTEANCQYRKKVEAFFETKGIRPEILMESSSMEAIIKIVEGGFGVTYLPEIVANENQRLKVLKIQDSENEARLLLQLLIHKNKWKSRTINEFIRICESNLKTENDLEAGLHIC